MRIRFIRWMIKILQIDKDYVFVLTRKGWLDNIAYRVSLYPNSKILTLCILRLDGSNLKNALKKYEGWKEKLNEN